VPPLLRDLAPGYKSYASLSGKALRGQLATLGVKAASTGNRWPVEPAEIRKALALRPVDDAE
jgi:S-DNA-T family DNA segregation ATPase FtsK/SpoIIIE